VDILEIVGSCVDNFSVCYGKVLDGRGEHDNVDFVSINKTFVQNQCGQVWTFYP